MILEYTANRHQIPKCSPPHGTNPASKLRETVLSRVSYLDYRFGASVDHFSTGKVISEIVSVNLQVRSMTWMEIREQVNGTDSSCVQLRHKTNRTLNPTGTADVIIEDPAA